MPGAGLGQLGHTRNIGLSKYRSREPGELTGCSPIAGPLTAERTSPPNYRPERQREGHPETSRPLAHKGRLGSLGPEFGWLRERDCIGLW